MEDGYRDIWELYGLNRDPFFTEPLSVFGGDIDIRLGFVGREEEVKRLQRVIGTNGGARTIVTGDVGVGKTTFVNFVRANAPPKRFFTPLKEIQTQPEWTGVDFILNTLAAIYNTIKVRNDLDPKQMSPILWKKLELLVDIVERRDRNFSLDIAGTGGAFGTSTTINVPAPTLNSLQTLYENLVTDIKKMGFHEIIISYNNLEVIESKDLVRLFNSIRDFIQTKDSKFVFIGGLTVPSTLSNLPRVQSIMSETPIVLQNLTLKELRDLLDKRIKYLTIHGLKAIKPYDDEAVSRLYALHDGNLRFVLNSLSTAFKEIVKDVPLVLSAQDIKKVLPEVVRKRWINKLTAAEKEVLMYILKQGEVTNKKIAYDLKKYGQNISPITKKLLGLCAIKCQREGTEKFFSVEHSIKWFLLEGESKEKQQPAQTKLAKDIQKILDS